MITIEEIYKILINLGYSLKDRGSQWSTSAIYRNGDNESAISINKKTGDWYDFVESTGGKLEQLIEKTIKQPITEEIKEQIISGKSKPRETYEEELEHIKVFNKELIVKLERNYNYWSTRGISTHTMEKFTGGIAQTGRMKNIWVFCIFNEREDLVGFTGRDLGNTDIKWKILGSKSNWVYPLINKNEIIKARSVILVESIGNAAKLMDNGINNVLVTFGTKISSSIIQFLIKLNLEKIYISFDNDSKSSFAGNKAAIENKEKLLNYFDYNQIQIIIPDGVKDWAEASSEYIKKTWKTNP